jgi:hypothetical protein
VGESRRTDEMGQGASAALQDPAEGALLHRLQGSNVNPLTLLATDYLNHFNEIVMIFGIVGDCPECLEDAAAWQPGLKKR